MRHVPVLLNEVVELLHLRPNVNVIDGTVGDAGHAEMILEKTAPNGQLLAIDADPESLMRAKQFLYRFSPRVIFVRDNFARLSDIIRETGFGPVHAILLDLGWSSPQMEERGRGLSFQKDEPLDMRYACVKVGSRAVDLISLFSEQELENIFREYGEEKLSKEIASAIVEERKRQPIEKTHRLVEIILSVYRKKLKTKRDIPWIGGLHPATKVFQALRIAVNDELSVIEQTLPQAVSILAPGGRLGVITFHSIEDRIVKHFFKTVERTSAIRIVTKKPIKCRPEERQKNPRAASAKLRVAERFEPIRIGLSQLHE